MSSAKNLQKESAPEQKEVLQKAGEALFVVLQKMNLAQRLLEVDVSGNMVSCIVNCSQPISANSIDDINKRFKGEEGDAAKKVFLSVQKVSGVHGENDDEGYLQKVTAAVFFAQDELEKYLKEYEEALKRDHRQVAKNMDLFHSQDDAAGSIFWHPRGWYIFRKIEEYIRKKLDSRGYQEIRTPQLIDKSLWEKSGHWSKFRENMFIAKSENRELAVKPMSCPGHVQIFNYSAKSYKDLPLRFAEFGVCHRNESSGSLHGLMRVRCLTQDDAHIFCTEEQVMQEVVMFCDLLREVYKDFGFNKVHVKFSDRPDVRAGSDNVWDKAESVLQEAVKAAGLTCILNKGEGAFYGPKLEFHLTDTVGRDWQCGTLQMDFVLPERLDAKYVAQDGSMQRPVMIHRAILGTIERFMGILLESEDGGLPMWLHPVPVVLCPITNDCDEYVKSISSKLTKSGVRHETDLEPATLSYKIQKYVKTSPFMVVVGKKEKESQTVSIRNNKTSKSEQVGLEDFIKKFAKLVEMP